MSTNINFFHFVSTLEKIVFTKHLAIMLKSGLPLDEALISLRDQTKNGYFKNVLNKILSDINNGQPLAKSLGKFSGVFNPFYISIIKIGEDSGSLEKNLEYLATEQQKSYEFKKKVQGALLYPGLILLSTLVMGGGIATFVLPQLVDLFKSLDAKLPLSTQILLALASFMKSYGLIVTPSIIIASALLYLSLQTKNIKPHWHRFLLSLPIFGSLFLSIELSSLCRNFGVMLKSGIPVNEALMSLHDASSNLVFKEYLSQIELSLNKGKKLSEEISNPKFKFIPGIVAKMVNMGEKSGNLEETFTYLGEFFEEEVDSTTKNLSTILEPVLLIIIGVFVTFMALAIISPIYSLTGSIRK